jgi:hypothetical protein
MAYNDMEVMVYRILKYLDECLKAGKTPTKEDILRDCQLYKLPEKYADSLLEELSDSGYVRGISKLATKDGDLITVQDNIRITLAGRQYLVENSRMQAAKEMLGRAFEIAIETAVKALLP